MKAAAILISLVLIAGCRLETREEAARHAASGQSADIEGMAAEALRALPTAIVDKATPFDPHHKGDAVLAVRLTGKVLAVTGGERARSMRSEEHTSEIQSLMRISYAVFCLTKKKKE